MGDQSSSALNFSNLWLFCNLVCKWPPKIRNAAKLFKTLWKNVQLWEKTESFLSNKFYFPMINENNKTSQALTIRKLLFYYNLEFVSVYKMQSNTHTHTQEREWRESTEEARFMIWDKTCDTKTRQKRIKIGKRIFNKILIDNDYVPLEIIYQKDIHLFMKRLAPWYGGQCISFRPRMTAAQIPIYSLFLWMTLMHEEMETRRKAYPHYFVRNNSLVSIPGSIFKMLAPFGALFILLFSFNST